jgi:RNA-directed DNA polymerase
MDPLERKMTEIPSSTSISTKLDRIATLAKQAPEMAFTSLSHHIDVDWLREAYKRTRKDGAAGIDGQTAAEYATHLEDNLRSLLDRAKSGGYRAPPVRRVHIPKGDGVQTRPIGIPTFEDNRKGRKQIGSPVTLPHRPPTRPRSAMAASSKRARS